MDRAGNTASIHFHSIPLFPTFILRIEILPFIPFRYIYINCVTLFLMRSSFHQPQLSTIRMVEQKIKKRKYFISRNQLFLSLGKSVMYPTITTILQYLEESKKVTVNKDGSIVWIFTDSHKVRNVLKKSKSYASRSRKRRR
jgi:hypothetical protein